MLKSIITIVLGILIASAIIGIVIIILNHQGDNEANKEHESANRIDTTKAMLSELESALDVYNAAIGHYPTEDEGGLNALLKKPHFDNPQAANNWHGPYLKTEPKDAWGHPLHYELVVDAHVGGPASLHIWSSGPDGTNGTADDIKNWSDETSR